MGYRLIATIVLIIILAAAAFVLSPSDDQSGPGQLQSPSGQQVDDNTFKNLKIP